jgi:hypothetical protein
MFFQNLYDSVVELFDGNDFKLDILVTFIISVTLYWSVGLSLLFLDLKKWPKFLYKYKIQDNESVSFLSLIKKKFRCKQELNKIKLIIDSIKANNSSYNTSYYKPNNSQLFVCFVCTLFSSNYWS